MQIIAAVLIILGILGVGGGGGGLWAVRLKYFSGHNETNLPEGFEGTANTCWIAGVVVLLIGLAVKVWC